MKKTLAGLLCLTSVVLFLAGCAARNKPALTRMREDYLQGSFEKCLTIIQRAKSKPEINADDRAQILLTEALCYEGLRLQERADQVYRSIIADCSDSEVAHRAHKRLIRKEGDQLPSLIPKFDSRRWKLQAKKWKDAQFLAQYRLADENPKSWTESINVFSADVPVSVISVKDKLEEIKAEMMREWPGLEWETIKEHGSEAYYFFKCPRQQTECGVGRVVLDDNRLHTIVYVARASELGGEARNHWMELLGAAELHPRPLRKNGSPTAPSLAAR
jgi:hypothetical protein